MAWNQKQISWYWEDEAFDKSPWWMTDSSGPNPQPNYDHPELLIEVPKDRSPGDDENQSHKSKDPRFRTGPIYWETLRRHPEIPALIEAINRGPGELGAPETRERLRVLPKEQQAVLFYLATLHRKTWCSLPEGVPPRFERSLPQFLISMAAEGSPAPFRLSSSVIDIEKEWAQELGRLMNFGAFLQEVDLRTLAGQTVKESVADEKKSGDEDDSPPVQLILKLEELQKSLAKFQMDIVILAVNPHATGAAASEDFRRIFEKRCSSESGKVVKSGRIRPDRLKHLYLFDETCHDSLRNAGDDTLKALRKCFQEFSFQKAIGRLKQRFD